MIYADLHIHSHYSRATSPNCTPEGLDAAARLKGISLCGTGDCTHPAWFQELSEKLLPLGNGFYRLSNNSPTRFLITGEISSIYKRDNKCHKVHSLILLPSLEAAKQLNARLSAIGNIHSDGRPILKLDPRDLLDLLLGTDPHCALIPAHIWTPWFSMLGAKSGFDSLSDCFGPLSPEIFAVETGLSSDIPMNRRIRCLDAVTLLSHSDLHSPANLGRNATCFNHIESYADLLAAMRTRDPDRFLGTVDLYPEMGKYFYDGHRACGICLAPAEAATLKNLCPVCGKPLTIGVLHRVQELELKQEKSNPAEAVASPFRYQVPLIDLIAQEYKVASTTSKKVQARYQEILAKQGPELPLLLDAPIEELAPLGRIGEMILAIRKGLVQRTPGYDGVYGKVKIR